MARFSSRISLLPCEKNRLRVSSHNLFHTAAGPGDITVIAWQISEPGAKPGLEEQLQGIECDVPPGGAVYLQFQEHGAGTEP